MVRSIKMVGAIIVFMLVLGGVLPGQAAALSTAPGCKNDNVIANGLWAGVNIALGTNYGCKNNAASGNASNSPGTSKPKPTKPKHVSYVALGDSVAVGLGLLAPKGGVTDCGLSAQAYSGVVAKSLNLTYKNAACSGATMGDLITKQHLSNTSKSLQPQLDAAFAGGRPTVTSITAGANDVQWQYFIRKCYVGNCGTNADNLAATALRTALEVKMDSVLSEINRRSTDHPPRVVITGYYKPVSAACATQQDRVTAEEIAWFNSQTDALNETLRTTAARYSFARFAPVDFSGHELCTANPWIQGLGDNAPFHPTVEGQRAIAQSVIAQVRR